MSINNMKRILILLLGLFSVAYGQFSPTSAKSAFKWGVSIGTRDSTAYAVNDSLVVVVNRQGRLMYRSTDGYWKILANAGGTDFVPYSGAVTNVNLGNYRLTARSIKTDSIYANSSAGMYLTTNSGNVVAHWGSGGSVEVDFKGFAGYDANRASSYTARSFTDKNYVDSSDALRVRYTDTAAMLANRLKISDTSTMLISYVTKNTAQNITAVKTFDSTQVFSKRAIISPNGQSYYQVTGVAEDGPALFINQSITNASSVNEHGIIDRTTFSRSGKAYNSYDAQAILSGTNNLDHYAGFQSRGSMQLTGATLSNYYSFLSAPDLTSGTVDKLYHFINFSTTGTVAGGANEEYGFYAKALVKGTKKYAFYSESDSSYFGNQVEALSFKKTSSTNAKVLLGAGSDIDTSTLLAGRWLPNRSLDTATALQTRIQTKLNISDTATMLSNYRRKTTLIENADLRNSAITINGASTALGGSISVGTVTSVSAGTGMSFSTITSSGAVNADTTTLATRAYAAGLDVAKANTSLNNVNGVLSSTYGGAGSVSGILKANGSGVVSAAVAGTDYVAPSALSGYLPLSGGTLTGNLSTSSSITLNNGQFYQATRSSGSLVTDMIGIPSGTDNVRILTTGNLNVVNGSLTNLLTIANSGAATFSGSVTVGGALSFSPSSSKIVSGITDFAIRNNADNTSMLHFNNSTLAATFTGSVYGIGFRYAYASKSSNYTLTDNDDYINVTSSCTITLPTAVGRSGKRYVIKCTGSAVATIASTSSQTIDGNAASTYSFGGPNFNIMIVYSDGSNWFLEAWATGI